MALVIKEFVIPSDLSEKRIDLIVQDLTKLPRSVIRGMFDAQCIYLNSETISDPGQKVSTDDKVLLKYDTHTKYKEKPKSYTSSYFSIVFEDDYLIVVDKKPGILSSPSNGYEKKTLLELVSHYVNRGRPRAKSLALVHRLDRDTSGLLIFGKSSVMGEKIKDQFEERKPERLYTAIVAGKVIEPTGTFKSYLATDKNLNQRSVGPNEGGKIAITHYEVVQVLKDTTVVQVTLETGRRNQIRVHFSEAGHPVLGDQRYLSEKAKHPKWPHKRLALHAGKLGLTHPVTGKKLLFSSPLPPEFLNWGK